MMRASFCLASCEGVVLEILMAGGWAMAPILFCSAVALGNAWAYFGGVMGASFSVGVMPPLYRSRHTLLNALNALGVVAIDAQEDVASLW